jgi:Tol biopolymer transport system component
MIHWARTGRSPVLCRLRLIAAALALAAPTARAQFAVRSWLPWRTIETRRFAFHYPADLEAWTRDAAARADAIDSAVAQVVGFEPSRKTDVVVDDPYATANGSAWPFLNDPIINLWAMPPEPRDDIGEFRDWGEMLVSHEFGHIAHLTRPSRNPLTRHLWQALPVDLGPIAIRAPRWVVEGYATYIEGKVTGSGRPHGAWRAAFLRQWALEGTLPRYEQLDASAGYAGGEFAYLAGSAFLEWLARRQGDSSLVHLWRRLTARQTRTFDEAFTGVFGESPRALYGRFTTDMTGKSLQVERAVRGASSDTGAIVQRLAWSTGDPAISPDGKRVALVVRSATAPSRVVVWSTSPEPDTGKARRDSVLLARDPQDVPARPIYPPPKRVLASLRASSGAAFEAPRFLRDGQILLSRNARRSDGTLSPDLYLWNPQTRSVRRVTRGAALRDADPLPGGDAAVATQCRRGTCGVVVVRLADGRVTELRAGDPTTSFYRPRVSPDGTQAVVSMHTAGGWHLVIIELRGSHELRAVPLAPDANEYDAAWIDSTSLVAVSDDGGVIDVERIELPRGERRTLSHVTGAAVAPEPNRADHSVWFISLFSRGYDLRRIERDTATGLAPALLAGGLEPVLPAPRQPSTIGSRDSVPPPRPFGLGPRLFRWIPAPQADADGLSAVLGLVSADIIGRSQLLARVAAGDAAAWRGGSVDFVWNGFRPGLRLSAFAAAERQSATRTPVSRPFSFDTKLQGAQLAIDGSWLSDAWAVAYRVGGSIARDRLDVASVSPVVSTATTRRLAFARVTAAWAQRGARSTFSESLGLARTEGYAFDTRFHRTMLSAGLATSGAGTLPVSAEIVYGATEATAPPFEQFSLGGGPPPLVDRDLLGQRIAMPALPDGISIGSLVLAYRISLNALPLAPFVWAGSTTRPGAPFDEWHRVAGLEWSGAIPSIPVAGTPAARGQLGIGESLDAPFRHRVRAYVSLVLNP